MVQGSHRCHRWHHSRSFPTEKVISYRSEKKDECSQNAMAIRSLNMCFFRYGLDGNDLQMIEDVYVDNKEQNTNFPHPS